MEIRQEKQGAALTFCLSGKMEVNAARELDKVLKDALEGVEELTIDLKDLAYIASSGLRTLFAAQKRMDKQGKMKILHVAPQVREVFRITGFHNILNIDDRA